MSFFFTTKFSFVANSNAASCQREFIYQSEIIISSEPFLSSVNYKLFIWHKTETLHVYKVVVGVIKFISKFPHWTWFNFISVWFMPAPTASHQSCSVNFQMSKLRMNWNWNSLSLWKFKIHINYEVSSLVLPSSSPSSSILNFLWASAFVHFPNEALIMPLLQTERMQLVHSFFPPELESKCRRLFLCRCCTMKLTKQESRAAKDDDDDNNGTYNEPNPTPKNLTFVASSSAVCEARCCCCDAK